MERVSTLSRETKPLIRSLGLEPIHFTVLLLKNSAVIEEDVIVMKKINRTLGQNNRDSRIYRDQRQPWEECRKSVPGRGNSTVNAPRQQRPRDAKGAL